MTYNDKNSGKINNSTLAPLPGIPDPIPQCLNLGKAAPMAPPVHVAAEQLHGFDISDYQVVIDFASSLKGGNRFCSIKASQGITETQEYYAAHAVAARTAGIPLSPYHFFEEHVPGFLQFQHHQKCAPRVSGDLYRMVDVESNGSKLPITLLGQANLADYLQGALKENDRIFIYYGYYFLYNLTDERLLGILGSKTEAGEWRCIPWPAAYGPHPLIAKPWPADVRPLLWQYTNNGNVPGIGRIDSDWLYCTESQFQALRLK